MVCSSQCMFSCTLSDVACDFWELSRDALSLHTALCPGKAVHICLPCASALGSSSFHSSLVYFGYCDVELEVSQLGNLSLKH